MSDLIQPIASGRILLDEIANDSPRPGSISVWWLGQSGYAIKSRHGLIVIDPYLSEHLTNKYADTDKPHVRMTAAPFRGGELTGFDAILASHKHSDHLDPGTVPAMLGASVGALLVVPKALISHAREMISSFREISSGPLPPCGGGLGWAVPNRQQLLSSGCDVGATPHPIPPSQGGRGPEVDSSERVVGIDAGETIEIAGFRIRAVASAHEGLDRNDYGHHLYLGFVVEVEGLRLYHSGDSLTYDGLVEALGSESFDVMFVPINGRDPRRGVAGNMSSAEAVDLAAVVRPRFVVPHHYDMFTFNTVPVETFEAEARRLPVGVGPKVLRCGERWEVGPWA